jgi:hypothetical protein
MTGKHLFTSDQKLAFWGNGEWVEEIDEFEWDYKGIKCEIVRCAVIENSFLSGLGHLNGYINIPNGHPWEHLDYDKIEVEVHGDLTFKETREDGLIMIGFDCAHSDDETPFTTEKSLRVMMDSVERNSEPYFKFREAFESMQSFNQLNIFRRRKIYRNVEFVKAQCESMVDQMLAVKVH